MTAINCLTTNLDRFKIVNCLHHSVDQGKPGSLASVNPATLDVGQKTHRRMLPQSAALEGLAADKLGGCTKRVRPGLSPTRHFNTPEGRFRAAKSERHPRKRREGNFTSLYFYAPSLLEG
ncbi:MAG: hypothetical protein ACE5PV_21870 [Candidatus Poribacteria bacterium]